jgi:hypothetical protein
MRLRSHHAPLLPAAILTCAFLAAAPPLAAADFAFGGSAGTLGVGVELTAGIAPQLHLRVGAHAGSYDDRREASDIEYDATARVRAGTARLDWHPGGRAFRLSAGAVFNDNEVEAESRTPASGLYEIGDVLVPAALLGSLRGDVEWDPVAPYAGIGFGNPLAPGRRWRLGLDLGVVFQGEPDVTLTPIIPAGSPLANPVARALLDIELAKEERDLEDEAADYDLYPVVVLGVSYRF